MVEIEECALGAFEEDRFALLPSFRQGLRHVGQEGRERERGLDRAVDLVSCGDLGIREARQHVGQLSACGSDRFTQPPGVASQAHADSGAP